MNGQIEEIIKIRGWIPGNLCVTSSGDLLVVICDGDRTQNKVVRYSGSVEKQTIQYEENSKTLYSGDYKKYITENRNLDLCVADRTAGAVAVVNQAGKLRFRYTGHTYKSEEKPFFTRGIATNSQSQILTADGGIICIHVLDQGGQFLRYTDNVILNDPNGICVDTLDNLYVIEYYTGDIKVIRYLK